MGGWVSNEEMDRDGWMDGRWILPVGLARVCVHMDTDG